jgi:hypothetical protein
MTAATPLVKQPRKLSAFLRSLKLESGGHSPDGQYCLMEAVAFIAGESWSDAPECVSPVIGAFGRSWNDSLDDAGRQRLKRFIPVMVGTATTSTDDEVRAGWPPTGWCGPSRPPGSTRLSSLSTPPSCGLCPS